MAGVALVCAYNGDGELLFGKRRDNGKWTLPGGHLNEGEDPRDGAERELFEETGLMPFSLSYLHNFHEPSNGLDLYCFSAHVRGTPTGENDPDNECEKWEFVDIRDGIPPKIWDHLHGPPGDTNLIKQVFMAQKMKKSENLGKAEAFPKDDPMLLKTPLNRACKHGLKAFTINGEHIRNHVDSDFVQGGNPERYKWIPKGEIWIDNNTPPEEIPYVMLHECDEANLMHQGEGYGEAHTEAKHVEDEHRHQDEPGELTKAEDEVHRLLDHPDVNERTAALKLNTVNARHLQAASLDPDPQVHGTAINHPQFGHREALHLMEASKGKDGKFPIHQQLAYLDQHKRVKPTHIDAFLKNVRANGGPADQKLGLDAVVLHPSLSEGSIRNLYLDPSVENGHRNALLNHPDAPQDVLEQALQVGQLVGAREAVQLAQAAIQHPATPVETVGRIARLASDLGSSHIQAIAEHGLRNHVISDETKERIFHDAQLKPSPSSGGLLQAMLAGPSAKEFDIERAHHDLKPEMMRYTLGAKHMQQGHFDGLVMHAHAAGDQELLGQLSNHPMFGASHLATMLHKSEPLLKHVPPEHFSSIVKASDPEASKLVDHHPDLNAHPPELGPEVEAYHNGVLKSPTKVGVARGTKEGHPNSGITRKKIFNIRVAGSQEPSKAMVKPYHERVIRRVKGWMKHPIQGWAEMTNQALFHAGGIGNLHQKVHVAEHDMGPGHEREPALIVHLSPGHSAVAEQGSQAFHSTEHSLEQRASNRMDVRKIAMMDFLANNKDRHSGNLMVNNKTGAPLAIDQSRNFQYVAPGGYAEKKKGDQEDYFGHYVEDSALGSLIPFKPHWGGGHENSEDYEPAFDWWGDVGPKVRQTFHDRLNQIKDPEVRAHLKRNFDERADFLDERSRIGINNYGNDWHRSTSVPMYREGELSDEEMRDPRLVEEHEGRMRERAARQAADRGDKVMARKKYKQWLSEKPQYPKEMYDLEPEARFQHPTWQKYDEDSKAWFARHPGAPE